MIGVRSVTTFTFMAVLLLAQLMVALAGGHGRYYASPERASLEHYGYDDDGYDHGYGGDYGGGYGGGYHNPKGRW